MNTYFFRLDMHLPELVGCTEEEQNVVSNQLMDQFGDNCTCVITSNDENAEVNLEVEMEMDAEIFEAESEKDIDAVGSAFAIISEDLFENVELIDYYLFKEEPII